MVIQIKKIFVKGNFSVVNLGRMRFFAVFSDIDKEEKEVYS